MFLNYSILRNEGVLYTPIRLALIGVLLYGKFMLLGQAIKLVLGDQEMKRIFFRIGIDAIAKSNAASPDEQNRARLFGDGRTLLDCRGYLGPIVD